MKHKSGKITTTAYGEPPRVIDEPSLMFWLTNQNGIQVSIDKQTGRLRLYGTGLGGKHKLAVRAESTNSFTISLEE